MTTGQQGSTVQVFTSRGLNTWLAACFSIVLLIGVSMLSVAESTVVERVMGAAITVGALWMIRSMLRRAVVVDAEGFEIRQMRTTRVPWSNLRSVSVGPSGLGYGVRVRIEGRRLPWLLPVGAFRKGAVRDDSVLARLAAVLSSHLPPRA